MHNSPVRMEKRALLPVALVIKFFPCKEHRDWAAGRRAVLSRSPREVNRIYHAHYGESKVGAQLAG